MNRKTCCKVSLILATNLVYGGTYLPGRLIDGLRQTIFRLHVTYYQPRQSTGNYVIRCRGNRMLRRALAECGLRIGAEPTAAIFSLVANFASNVVTLEMRQER